MTLTRRDFLKVAGVSTTAAALLAACGNSKTVTVSDVTADTTTTEEPAAETTETAETPAAEEEAAPAEAASYTYHGYTSALGDNWNPHTWEDSGDSDILSYVTTPFVDMSILDSENEVYQWVYEAASAITDVTADHQDLLTACPTDNDGTATEGYVFQFDLRPEMKWQDGTPINADTYEYSLKALLDPAMLNYRANLYYSGESAFAGAKGYFFAGSEAFTSFDDLGYATVDDAIAAGYTEDQIVIDCYDFWGASTEYTDADGNACPNYVALTDETVYGENVDDAFSGSSLYADYGAYLCADGGYGADIGVMVAQEARSWDEVGFKKIDDYTFLIVTEVHNDINTFLGMCTDNWLVYEEYYEGNKTTTGEITTTTYNSSVETTMSYGTYMIDSLQEGRQIVYVQNPNWWNFTQNEDGTLTSMTQFEVDGESIEQYKTTKIVIDVMDDNAAKLAFLKGELTEWTPQASELSTYSTSEQLYRADETYTIGYSFHTNLDDLKEMDASKGNTNSVVLSNDTFRKAMSYAMDRATYVTATAGYKVAFYTMNNLYYYDVYNNPESQYRATDEAKTAIVNLYGVEYGDDKIYKTLDEAYDSITGYNVTEAQELFTQACQELVAAGLYTEGEDIVIKLAMAKGEISDDQNQQVALANTMLNAALEGTGFGTLTLDPVGNISDRYAATASGEYAMNVGGWGGAAFYPYRNFQVYMDPDQYSITEAGCWDPTTETLTLTVNGEEVTMTYQEWSGSMVGSGVYAQADDATKLQITADLEYNWLNKYYFIPLYYLTSCTMMSYQVNYYVEDYNIMYGFGGLRLLQWNYNDTEWTDYVASQGGELSYE